MSRLQEVIDATRTRANQPLHPMTVRVTEPMRDFVEEFAEGMNITRQEALVLLLEDGIETARKLLGNPEASATASRFHVLNTNKAHSDEDHEMMVKEGIAAAFYEPWNRNIDRLQAGDWVFLYENRAGIVAFGQASGETKIRDHQGNKDVCKYQVLSNFTTLKKPMTAAEIKEVLGRNVVFLRTMVGMPDGDKVLRKLQASTR